MNRNVFSQLAAEFDRMERTINYQKEVIASIVHAFLFESGLAENSEWAQNEEMVDWFACQAPKIYAAFRAAGAI